MVRCRLQSCSERVLDAQRSSSHAWSTNAAAKCSATGERAASRSTSTSTRHECECECVMDTVYCVQRSLQRRIERSQKRQEAGGRRHEAVRTSDVDGAVLAEQDVAGLDVPAARNESTCAVPLLPRSISHLLSALCYVRVHASLRLCACSVSSSSCCVRPARNGSEADARGSRTLRPSLGEREYVRTRT